MQKLLGRTFVGAMLWEIWSQHKILFLAQGAALLALLCAVYWKMRITGGVVSVLLSNLPLPCLTGAIVVLALGFTYLEADARKVQIGFPSRLFLKPVSTLKLAATPMFFGGLTVVLLFVVWTKFIVQPLHVFPVFSLLWMSAVLLSFFWWLQALAWSLPLLVGRGVVVLLMVGAHLGMAIVAPTSHTDAPQLYWLILAAMLFSAPVAALVGLTLMRRGHWENPSRFSALWKKIFPARTQLIPARFPSALRAQFWLEWRRQGLLFPFLSSGIVLVNCPILFIFHKEFRETWQADDPQTVALPAIILGVPMLISAMLATAMAKFDPLQPSDELPVYITVRPMTDGSFVLAKLLMALTSTFLAWFLTLTFGCLGLILVGNPFAKIAPLFQHYDRQAIRLGCLWAVIMLVLWTWKNLMGGIAAGLAGRRWIVVLFNLWKWFYLFILGWIGVTLFWNGKFALSPLLHLLFPLLWMALAAKIVVAALGFSCGLRRNIITHGYVAWNVASWLISGLLMACLARVICQLLHQPAWWIWAVLAGFLVFPLADLALAPLALTWNRHR